MLFKSTLILLFSALLFRILSQEEPAKHEMDLGYILEVQQADFPPKVLHAEPLYIDLIRDLGARAGEAEWNVGFGMQDRRRHVEYHALVEYEWAPIDRLGLEVELPFFFNNPYQTTTDAEFISDIPSHKLESLKLAGQYTFFVSTATATSLAFGYIHEFLFPEFRQLTMDNTFHGNVYNPFFIAAKRWGNNLHTLVYTGPYIEALSSGVTHTEYHLNANVHWMISGTRNFIGLETNIINYQQDWDIVFRPQLRVSLADNFLIGIVAAVPMAIEQSGMGFFIRAIYEPGHEH